MKILAVNAGSSSLKFRLYEMPEGNELMKGNFERIGLDNSFYSFKYDGFKIQKEAVLRNHVDAVNCLKDELLSCGVITDFNEIEAIGHRVVHGGDKYSKSILIDDVVLNDIDKLSNLAPLHNPGALSGIKAFMNVSNAKMVACFDTAFHQTIDKVNYLYSVPLDWYSEYGVRKYGFHGLSHKYINDKVSDMIGKKCNLIVCHLGNGASLSCIKNGECIDTTMGLTPNAGVMMGTRSGDIDYTLIDYVMKSSGMSFSDVDTSLNKKSGLLGITGMSDFRDIDKAYLEGESNTVLGMGMYVNRVVKYIADYYIKLDGEVDGIVFTAGVGENDTLVREMIVNKLNPLGIYLDKLKNEETVIRNGREGIISMVESKVNVYAYATDEEFLIVSDTYEEVK